MPEPIGISGSRSAAILGLSQYQTPVGVWLEIMEKIEPGFCNEHGYTPPEREYNAAMRFGHAFESAIIELAERAQGRDIVNREMAFSREYMTCHIDGEYAGDPFTLHEGKTTSIMNFRDAWGEPGSDAIPMAYQLQVQHMMLVTGAQQAIVSVLVFPQRVEAWEEAGIVPAQFNGVWALTRGDGIIARPIEWAHILDQMGYFHQYIIPANPDLHALMLAKYAEWWERHVIGRTPPVPTRTDDIKALVRDPVGTIVCTEEMERYLAEYRDIGSEISQSGALAKKREQNKVFVLDAARSMVGELDDESRDRWVFRSRDGRRLATWGKDKAGRWGMR